MFPVVQRLLFSARVLLSCQLHGEAQLLPGRFIITIEWSNKSETLLECDPLQLFLHTRTNTSTHSPRTMCLPVFSNGYAFQCAPILMVQSVLLLCRPTWFHFCPLLSFQHLCTVSFLCLRLYGFGNKNVNMVRPFHAMFISFNKGFFSVLSFFLLAVLRSHYKYTALYCSVFVAWFFFSFWFSFIVYVASSKFRWEKAPSASRLDKEIH